MHFSSEWGCVSECYTRRVADLQNCYTNSASTCSGKTQILVTSLADQHDLCSISRNNLFISCFPKPAFFDGAADYKRTYHGTVTLEGNSKDMAEPCVLPATNSSITYPLPRLTIKSKTFLIKGDALSKVTGDFACVYTSSRPELAGSNILNTRYDLVIDTEWDGLKTTSKI